MSAVEVLQKLRRFLLVLSVLLFGGALVELWLVGHTADWIQWIPFGLSIVGSFAALLMLFRPGGTIVRILRICMVVIVLGTLFGIYQHIAGNIALEREIDPKATTSHVVSRGLSGGNPLLAPGVLAIAAVLAFAATYRYQIGASSQNQMSEQERRAPG